MKHELYINGFKVDLSNDIPFPISFSIADIKNPESRKRSISKTIVLEGTQNNKDVFSGAYELSLSDDGSGLGFNIDPTIRVEARYVKNSREIFNGLCQLLQVNIDKGVYRFEIVLFSNFVDIFQKWGDVTIGELGWSEYNHDLTIGNIINSWQSAVVLNGGLAVNFLNGKPLGFGYVYPWIDFGYSTSEKTLNINDLVPYVYVREVIQKAFDYVGYTVDSEFWDEDKMRALLFGFGGGKKNMLPPTDVIKRRVNYSFDGLFSDTFNDNKVLIDYGATKQYAITTSTFINLSEFVSSQINDGYLQYDEINSRIVVQRGGKYSIDLDTNLIFDGQVSNVTTFNNLTGFKIQVFKNGSAIHSTTQRTIPKVSSAYSVDVKKDFDLSVGDIVEVKLFVFVNLNYISSSPEVYTFNVNLNNDFSFDLQSQQGAYQEGDIITLNRFIPEMKVSTFIKGMTTIFNLYIDDATQDNVVKIEPLLDFYNSLKEADNWTHKLDHSRQITIKPSSSITGKTYSFEFEKETDYYNNKYLEEYEKGYGNYDYELANGYAKGKTIFKAPFGIGVPVEGTFGFVRPRLIKIDIPNNVVEPYKGKAKLFFYNGLRDSQININYSLGIYSNSQYPQVHHSYGDIQSPDFDLLFSQPEEVFYSYVQYNNSNSFNKYHRPFIRELTDRDAKLLTAYFKLDDLDIYNTMFRNLVNINGVIYRKNLIVDYDATGYMTTKCELIKVLETSEINTNDIDLDNGIPVGEQTSLVLVDPQGVGEGINIVNGGFNSVLETQNIITYYGNRF